MILGNSRAETRQFKGGILFPGTISVTSMRLLLLICILLEPALSLHEHKGPIMIAVLLPDDNIRPFSMRKVLPAIQIAVEKVMRF